MANNIRMIVIINYKMGNLESVKNMLKRIGHDSIISSDPLQIAQAHKLILPGVGAFDAGMDALNELGLIDVLNRKVLQEKTPVLGICLGMQLLTKSSQEGRGLGLGWIDAQTEKFSFNQGKGLKIPHMGWNTVSIKKESKLMAGFGADARFYFVHSYHVVCRQSQDILSTTHHGYDFVSAIERDNILGVQFHPEKSHAYGMHLLKNFCESY